MDAAVAAILETIRDGLRAEVQGDDTRNIWRRRVLNAHRQIQNDPDVPEPMKWEDWEDAVESLNNRLLWDTDYALADHVLDADPETIRPLRQALAIEDDYFTAIAPDPTPEEVEQARQTLRRVLGPDQVAEIAPEEDGLPF